MSLAVSVFAFDKDGEEIEIELEKGKDLAGFENSRDKLYGSELAEHLGLKLLSQLKHHDLYDIKDEKLNELEAELKTILENIEEFSRVSEFKEEYIKARVQNISDAVQIARQVNGTVVIW
jgi:hypothetical protein